MTSFAARQVTVETEYLASWLFVDRLRHPLFEGALVQDLVDITNKDAIISLEAFLALRRLLLSSVSRFSSVHLS